MIPINIQNYIKKNIYNILILSILVIGIIIRLIFFNTPTTIGWDEGVYLSKAKSIAFNTPDTTWGAHRPPLMPIIWGGLLKIQNSEFLLRVLQLLFSVLVIFFSYLLASELFNRKIGLITSLLLSFFYLHVFFSVQLLTDFPSLTLILLAFWLYTKTTQDKFIDIYKFIIIGIILGITYLIRFPSGVTIVTICLLQLFIYRFKPSKQKGTLLMVISFFLTILPYLIYSYIYYDNPLAHIMLLWGMAGGGGYNISVFVESIQEYIYQFNFLLIPLFVGFYVLGSRLFKKNQSNYNIYFIAIWLLLNIAYFGFIVKIFVDRWFLQTYPFLFMIVAIGIIQIFNYVKKIDIKLGYLIAFVLITSFALHNLTQMKNIKRLTNYASIEKGSGLWLKENSQKNDIAFSTETQLQYYSEREVYIYPDTEKKFLNQVENLKPRFLIISEPKVRRQYQYINSFLETNKTNIVATITDSREYKKALIYEIQR